jgi:cellulose synthase (UDP-forming)
VYEGAVAFPLARATLDLVLPKALGFKVTPKGITTARRRFDFASSRLTLAAAALALAALTKGTFELVAFGIEVEAYAFNLFWAGANLVALLAALLVAWERPQQRADERVQRRIAARVVPAGGANLPDVPDAGGAAEAWTVDLSSSGAGIRLPGDVALPAHVEVELLGAERIGLRARVVWRERVGREERAGLAFVGVDVQVRRALVRLAFSADGAFAGAHAGRARSQLGMATRLLAGIARAFLPLRPRRRLAPRRRALRPLSFVGPRGGVRALRLDIAPGGLGLVTLGGAPALAGTLLPVILPDRVRWARVAHVRRVVPGVWRLGLAYLPAPVAAAAPRVYVAA